MPNMERVAVVGVGLIGGSFALALRQSGYTGEILGVSSSSTIEAALSRGVIDRAVSLDEAAAECDLLYLAHPIRQILTTLEALSGKLKPGALVTDVGSTKAVILAKAKATVGENAFLGAHPMAGKELRGVAAAEAGLFQGRTYFLCAADPQVLDHPVAEELVELVEKFGARPVLISAEDHDRLVSMTSHLPQLASTALAAMLSRLLDPRNAVNGTGPGLMDMTRLAKSSHELWADILATNTTAIDRALSLYIKELQEVRLRLGQQDLQARFEEASSFAAMLPKRTV